MEFVSESKVTLISSMGNDQTVVQAARVSYAGAKPLRKDDDLREYLYKNHHTSPFEHVHFTFLIECPIFIARQILRHRTANVSEISGRYSILKDKAYLPNLDRICHQSKDNKQCSGEALDQVNGELARKTLEVSLKHSFFAYHELLDLGVSREIARTVLPLSTFTSFYFTMDLKNLLHFLRLRLHEHAQKEAQDVARKIVELIQPIVPHCVSLFLQEEQSIS